jgi:hypothetical protein
LKSLRETGDHRKYQEHFPNEFAIDGSYSLKLSENILHGVGRYPLNLSN